MEKTQIKRIGAIIIDLILSGVVIGLTDGVLRGETGHQSTAFGLDFTYKFSTGVLVYLCYFSIFDLLNHGRTVGKMILGVRVVAEDDFMLSRTDHLKRTLLKIVSLIILPIAILLFLFKRYYTIHDHFANSITVNNER